MHKGLVNISAARLNLRRLTNIRYIALGGQVLFLVFFTQVYPLGLPVITLSVLVAAFGLANILTRWRSHGSKTISEAEFCAHLLVDIAALSCLLYLSGGATNPFISYYLVPISIAAITHIYLEADLAMKERALQKLPPLGQKVARYKPSG